MHVVKAFQDKVPPLVTTKVNQILNSFSTDIKITDKIYMKYQFPNTPIVGDKYLMTGIVVYLHPVNDPSPPPGPITPMSEIDANPKGAQFFLSGYIVRSVLNTDYKLNVMTIKVNTKLDGHQVSMTCSVSKVLDFKFTNAISAVVDGICNVALDNDPNPKFQVILALQLELKEKVKNAILFFYAEKFAISKLEFKMIHQVDIEWFKKVINEVTAVILEVINGELGQEGIPLPTIKEVDYTDIVQYIGNGLTMVGTTPVFHITMEDEEIVLGDSSEAIEVDDELLKEYPYTKVEENHYIDYLS
jgi:hypothetical protein